MWVIFTIKFNKILTTTCKYMKIITVWFALFQWNENNSNDDQTWGYEKRYAVLVIMIPAIYNPCKFLSKPKLSVLHRYENRCSILTAHLVHIRTNVMTSILELDDDFWQRNRELYVRNSNYSVCNNEQHHFEASTSWFLRVLWIVHVRNEWISHLYLNRKTALSSCLVDRIIEANKLTSNVCIIGSRLGKLVSKMLPT